MSTLFVPRLNLLSEELTIPDVLLLYWLISIGPVLCE